MLTFDTVAMAPRTKETRLTGRILEIANLNFT